MKKDDCVFCNVVSGAEQASVIWSDDKHVAFHSIFPGTEGHTLVVAKEHVKRFRFETPANDMVDLIYASRIVGKLLDNEGQIVQAGLVVECSDVDHVHAKFIPLTLGSDGLKVSTIS